jgi:hypothetical protein
MAFSLAFTTTDYDQGRSIIINDASTDWANVPVGVVSATFSFTSLYTGVTLTPVPLVITVPIGTEPFVAGFSYEIKNTQLGFAATDTIPDSIYRIKMEISNGGGIIPGAGNTYTSEEVCYYNALAVRNKYIAEVASYVDKVYTKQQEYANWLDFLCTSIEANALTGNSSGIYYTFDIFSRLDEV